MEWVKYKSKLKFILIIFLIVLSLIHVWERCTLNLVEIHKYVDIEDKLSVHFIDVSVYRTDKHGDIIVITDGYEYSVKVEKNTNSQGTPQ